MVKHQEIKTHEEQLRSWFVQLGECYRVTSLQSTTSIRVATEEEKVLVFSLSGTSSRTWGKRINVHQGPDWIKWKVSSLSGADFPGKWSYHTWVRVLVTDLLLGNPARGRTWPIWVPSNLRYLMILHKVGEWISKTTGPKLFIYIYIYACYGSF